MDIDISDILASVTRAHPGAVSSGANDQLLNNSAQQQADLQALTGAWVSERVAPELLPYPTHLMERSMDRIRQQGGIPGHSPQHAMRFKPVCIVTTSS